MKTVLRRFAEQMSDYWQTSIAVQTLLVQSACRGPVRRPAARLRLVHVARAA